MNEVDAEFDLIAKYFTPSYSDDDIILGVGDDCAVVDTGKYTALATTVDTLVEGVHFPVSATPEDIAYKSIAVSISDLCAMGARPAWLTLALTMPAYNETWIQLFADSFLDTASHFDVKLIGGDTTKGPLCITVQATGYLDSKRMMSRHNAHHGDNIYVTGTLGDAAYGLKFLNSSDTVNDRVYRHCLDRLNRPQPNIAFSCDVSEICSCAIDISDGLIADLGHILAASHCGADLQLSAIPLSEALGDYLRHLATGIDWQTILTGGDDYELCLVVPNQHDEKIKAIARNHHVQLTNIGTINVDHDIRVIDEDGKRLNFIHTGYKHF